MYVRLGYKDSTVERRKRANPYCIMFLCRSTSFLTPSLYSYVSLFLFLMCYSAGCAAADAGAAH